MVRRRRRRGRERSDGRGKTPDNLAWLFYKDGVRELDVATGFEETEVVQLLQIIQRARKASPDEDDLVTMLWEADFAFLKYKYIDLLSEGAGGELADGGDRRRRARRTSSAPRRTR